MKFFDVYQKMNLRLVGGQGTKVTSDDGTTYTDFYGGHAVISVGHSHPKLVKALTSQLSKLAYYSNAVQMKEQDELASTLERFCPPYLSQIFLVNSGSEAVENALKLAAFETGRSKIISFEGSFHGRTSLSVQVTDNPNLCSPVNTDCNVVHLPLNDENALSEHLDADTAAVIIEGIQGVGGCREASTGFLKAIERHCKDKGALLILDEIQSGCARTGHLHAYEHHGIIPDLVTTAKGIGGGFPVGAVLIHEKIPAKQGSLGTTFGGNPMACVAMKTVFEIIEEENLMSKAKELGSYLIKELEGISGISAVYGRGLMIGFELEKSKDLSRFRSRLLNEGHFITGFSPKTETVRLLPPLNIEKKEIDRFLEKTEELLL